MPEATRDRVPDPQGARAPEAVSPPPGNPRFPLIDGLRALAVLLVLAYHVGGGGLGPGHQEFYGALADHADIGVTLFFVISGFLLYRPFVAARIAGTRRPSAIKYARRRALRILPAYWLALTVLAIYPGVAGVFSKDWWAYYGFAQIYRLQWLGFKGIPQAWSLSVEITFYLALPLLAYLLASIPAPARGRRVLVEVAAVGGLGVAALAFRYALGPTATGIGPQTLPGLFTWFAVGMLLAVASAADQHARRRIPALDFAARHPTAFWAAAAGLYLLVAVTARHVLSTAANVSVKGLVVFAAYAVISLLLVVPAVFGDGRRSLPARVLGHPVAAWLGLISYGVFLYQIAVLTKLADWGLQDSAPRHLGFPIVFLAGLAGSVACAALSYHLVEQPILRYKDRPLLPARRPVAAASPPESPAGR